MTPHADKMVFNKKRNDTVLSKPAYRAAKHLAAGTGSAKRYQHGAWIAAWVGTMCTYTREVRDISMDAERSDDILGKSTRKRLLSADFLTANEGIDCHGDGSVDVLCRAVIGQAHLAESLGDTHDGFEMTDLNGKVSMRMVV